MGIASVDHVDPVSHFLHFNFLNAPVQVNVVWGSVWIGVVSEIWKHNNKHIFQGGVIDHLEVFTLAQLKVWSWITSKIVSARFTYSEWCIDPMSMLVNGSPTDEFIPSRGLRQGDPLAPFLFIVVVEGLAGLIRQAGKAHLLCGLKIGRKEVELSLLQFAGDTLFLCEDSYANVVTLKAILRGFELASGLKINFNKSKLSGINVLSRNIDCYTKTLNCAQMGILFSYLGLEVGGNPRKKKFWEPVLNKLIQA